MTARAPTVFLIVSGVFALLSMMGPINLGGADGATKAVLIAMHLVAAAPITAMVLRVFKR